VGNAAGQRADGFELLHLDALLLEESLIRDVPQDTVDTNGQPPVVADEPAAGREITDAPVGPDSAVRRLVKKILLNGPGERGLDRLTIFGMHCLEKLLCSPGKRRRLDPQQLAGQFVEIAAVLPDLPAPDAHVGRLQRQVEPRLVLEQRRLGLLALGDVDQNGKYLFSVEGKPQFHVLARAVLADNRPLNGLDNLPAEDTPGNAAPGCDGALR